MGRPRPRSSSGRPRAGADIDAATLVLAFEAGAEALSQQADALNAINVFPVPDGDTGTNMSLTMRAALDEMQRSGPDGVAAVASAAAHGALMGAKGNSGVILSQIVDGFSAAFRGREAVDAGALAAALERGRQEAYRVISAPREGTILTAISAASAAAGEAVAGGADAEGALVAAVDATQEAVARTPELLPLLAEAGVVDAGAQGLWVFFDGMLRGLRGEEISGSATSFGTIDASWLAATQRAHGDGARSGCCTEFVIEGPALDADAIRATLEASGESVLVVGGGEMVRVHVHTHDPESALAYGRTLGTLSHEKVDDMEAQFRALASGGDAALAPRTGGAAVVAVGAGAGIEALFRSIGAAEVVHGGQTMNPSAGEIRSAIVGTGAADVIVLPNNKNIVLAAEQAAASLPGRVRVLPARSVPQGVAALVAMNPEATFDENIEAMTRAAGSVRTAEVTRAARATRVHGLAVRQGQPIGLIDGDLRVAEETVADAVRRCVELIAEGRAGSLVTLYLGEGEDEESASGIADGLRETLGVEVEVVAGGQPHYPYLIGVE